MAWSIVLGAAVAFAFAAPVYAEPALPNTVPDSGARPLPMGGPVQLPGAPIGGSTPGTGLTLGSGPLATQIYLQQTQVATLGENLLTLRQSRDNARVGLATAEHELRMANETLAKAQVVADAAAAEALKKAAALPPGTVDRDLHGLGALNRLQKGQHSIGDTSAPVRELGRARDAQQAASQKVMAAQATVTDADQEFTKNEAEYQRLEAALRKLRQDNLVQIEALEREQEAAEQRIGEQYLKDTDVNGMRANPRALAAVSYALAQLGDPYLWGAEGPNRFDCSGLMWAAYRSPKANYRALPRVAKDQYYATRNRPVARHNLLPGDLLFFASTSSWTSVHHVGMYIGDGKMVHAPTAGDVVKRSVVPWSRLYAATRVIDAVPAPTSPSPTPTKPPTTGPSPTPTKPPTSPSPTPTNSPSNPPTTPPTTPPATTSPSTTPSAEPTASPEPTGGSAGPTPTGGSAGPESSGS
ncbi:C40 family peptidase [Micromonospora sp. NPDC003197]